MTRKRCVVLLFLLVTAMSVGSSGVQPVKASIIGSQPQPTADNSGEWQHMRLIGTAVSRERERCRAVIVDSRSMHQRFLRIGDRVGEVLIIGIEHDRLIIQAESGEKVLRLKHHPAQKTAARARERRQETAATGRPGRHRSYLIDRERFTSALSNKADALNSIAVWPASLLNQRAAVRVAAVEPESVFQSLGLKRGDLLLGINDHPIATPEDIESVLQAIAEKGTATLTLRRRLRTYHFDVELQ